MKKHNSYSITLLLSAFLLFSLVTSFVLTSCGDSSADETPNPTEEIPAPNITEETGEVTPTETTQATASEEIVPEPTVVSEADASTPEQAGLTAVINSGDFAGEGKPFTFDATQSQENGHPIIDYEWNMGDGAILFGVSVEHAYSDAGFYTVSLTITDDSGATDTTTKTVEVIELSSGPPVAVLEGPDTVAVGEEVTFSAASSQPGVEIIAAYQWDSGDGDETEPMPDDTWTTVYGEPGIYYAEVTVIDASGLTSSAALEISVEYTLNGTNWLMDDPIRGTEVTLVFSEHTLSGSSGCNDYTGNYSTTDWDGNTVDISISITNSTGRSCSQEIMHQEQGYQSFLRSATQVTVSEDKLTMESSSGSITFSRMAT
jgi:heat shock protein HslJ